jgi:quinoprotein relay system zinc metallohydrolase 2
MADQARSTRRCTDRVKHLLLLFCGLVGETCAAGTFNLVQLAPGVFLHQGQQLALDAAGHDDIANIGFIVGSRCVAVIDTGGSVTIGRQLRAAVKQHTPLPICYVINTHVHVDHVLGNFAFRADHPSFVGHQALAEAIANSRQFFVAQYGADLDAPAGAEQIMAPDRWVPTGQETVLDLGHRRLHLRAWPKAHTDCDLTVYDEHTRTLWTGDLLFRERVPALDGSVRGWLAVIDQLAAMQTVWAVPGHGSAARDLAQALAPERRYLQALLDGVSAELARGNAVQDAIEHVGVEEQPNWLLWSSAHAHNVIRAYEELQWE